MAKVRIAPLPSSNTLPPVPGRTPLQGRSRASLERMLGTARDLMLERGNEEFTLQEVSSRGQVSIGSIYLRFPGKDALVRAVLVAAIGDLRRAEEDMLYGLLATCQSMGEFVERYVVEYAEVLKIHAPLLRLAMLRAEQDREMSVLGKAAADNAVACATNAFMAYSKEIGGGDPSLRAQSAYHIIFATLARWLSLGATSESSFTNDWNILKRELARMSIAYLRSA